jgi:hypothetical protein
MPDLNRARLGEWNSASRRPMYSSVWVTKFPSSLTDGVTVVCRFCRLELVLEALDFFKRPDQCPRCGRRS